MFDVDAMLAAYTECALWSSSDNDDDAGTTLGENYGPADLAPSTRAAFRRDCKAFAAAAGPMLSNLDATQVGHDFWLTRNRHGAGFWDGDYPEILGETLTTLSRQFGEQHLVVENGKIYVL